MTDTERSLTLLVSSMSARGRSLRFGRTVTRILRAGGWKVTVVVTTSGDAVDQVAAKARGSYVAAIGGDGYLAAVAGGVLSSGKALITFPGGRGNDLCRALSIGNDPLTWARTLSEADCGTVRSWVRSVDTMEVESKDGRTTALGVLSLGIDAMANELANRTWMRSGSLAYTWGAALGFAGKFKPQPVIADVDGVRQDIGGWLTSVSNTGWFGGGINISPGSRLDDGTLEVIHVERIPRLIALPLLTKALLFRQIDHPAIHIQQAKSVEFLEPVGLPVLADGDVIGHIPMMVKAKPGALKVVAPDIPDGGTSSDDVLVDV